jgi:hypothetical protein
MNKISAWRWRGRWRCGSSFARFPRWLDSVPPGLSPVSEHSSNGLFTQCGCRHAPSTVLLRRQESGCVLESRMTLAALLGTKPQLLGCPACYPVAAVKASRPLYEQSLTLFLYSLSYLSHLCRTIRLTWPYMQYWHLKDTVLLSQVTKRVWHISTHTPASWIAQAVP